MLGILLIRSKPRATLTLNANLPLKSLESFMKKLICLLLLIAPFCSLTFADDWVDQLSKGFEPLIRRGIEWQCRGSFKHTCDIKECKSVQEQVDWFEVDLKNERYRLCSILRWMEPNQGECLDWTKAKVIQSGIYTLIPAQAQEGYVKIENTSLNFIAVGNFMGLSNKTYLGKCSKKSRN